LLTVAPAAIENKIQVFTHNTVSCCGVARDASKDNVVEVLPVEIQYFDWKNGGLHSKLTEVQQQMNKAKETVTQYSKKLLTITVH
jgi:hypothetical protein